MCKSTEINQNTVNKTIQRCKSKVPTIKNLEVLKSANIETNDLALKSIKSFLPFCSSDYQSKILESIGA